MYIVKRTYIIISINHIAHLARNRFILTE